MSENKARGMDDIPKETLKQVANTGIKQFENTLEMYLNKEDVGEGPFYQTFTHCWPGLSQRQYWKCAQSYAAQRRVDVELEKKWVR